MLLPRHAVSRTCAALAAALAFSATALAQTLDLGDLLGGQIVPPANIQPIYAASAPGDPPTRLFIVNRTGSIDLYDLSVSPATRTRFATIPSVTGSETGLLSMAFHPGYNTPGSVGEGRFFVYYTRSGPRNLVASMRRSATNPNLADPASLLPVIIVTEYSAGLHNGGSLQFGPDGMLYIGIGDHAQSTEAQNGGTLVGKLLRLDIDGDDFPTDPDRNYRIPPDNPTFPVLPLTFFRTPRRELWAIGLRNPWRLSFDRLTGDLVIGDVGEGTREEIDWVPGNGGPGRNFGWPYREGNYSRMPPPAGFDLSSLTYPVYDYPNPGGAAVVGGFVYRGSAIPGWRGRYFFGDYIAGWIRSFRVVDGVATDLQTHTGSGASAPLGGVTNVSGFGQDSAGELYITSLLGSVYKVVPSPLSASLSVADVARIGGIAGPDGLLTGDDFIFYINAFAAGDPVADIASSGGGGPDNTVTGDDFVAFIAAFTAGD